MDYAKKSVELHETLHGKLEIASKVPIASKDDLSVAYTPGVAEPCREIARDPSRVWDLTIKSNAVAVVTDGSAVLGLGNIGPEAGLPVMEGKAILFKQFGQVDAYPICLATQDPDEIVETVKRIAPGFGAINLEDIAAPACFEIEKRLVEELGIPVMHDDQHGTAVVILAGLLNALSVVRKEIGEIRVLFSGAGAAGIAAADLLAAAGVKEIAMTDSKGVLAPGREGMNVYKEHIVEIGNSWVQRGTLADAMNDSDVFIGLSKPGVVTEQMIRSMRRDPIIFAMANPDPEILPDVAHAAGAAVVATGRSDFPNQINNALAFPGMFRGALDARARRFTQKMKLSAAHALAAVIPHPTAEAIIASPLDPHVHEAVARAVKEAIE